MIPFIRSHSELMAITESRDIQKYLSKNDGISSITVDSAQRKRYLRSLAKKEVGLPALPKTKSNKWKLNKENVSRLHNYLEYNNQIQSSYDINLLEIENKRFQNDVA